MENYSEQLNTVKGRTVVTVVVQDSLTFAEYFGTLVLSSEGWVLECHGKTCWFDGHLLSVVKEEGSFLLKDISDIELLESKADSEQARIIAGYLCKV